tara:strand:- start:445 stop:759 length:315 start_codon:yes stop_codon:yes gene_type:complete
VHEEKMKQLLQILTIAILLMTTSCCDILCERQVHAELIIDKVEKFKQDKGRLPEDLTEIGLDGTQMHLSFYQLTSDTTYMVWYGLGVGESKIYRSKTKKWTEAG